MQKLTSINYKRSVSREISNIQQFATSKEKLSGKLNHCIGRKTVKKMRPSVFKRKSLMGEARITMTVQLMSECGLKPNFPETCSNMEKKCNEML